MEPCRAKTARRASKMYRNSPFRSEKERAALVRWHELSLEEAKAAVTLEESKKAFKQSPDESEAGVTAFLKWVELCPTVREIRRAYRAMPEDDSIVSVLVKALFMKWIELCTTIKEVREVYDLVPGMSYLEKMALLKIYQLFPGSETTQ